MPIVGPGGTTSIKCPTDTFLGIQIYTKVVTCSALGAATVFIFQATPREMGALQSSEYRCFGFEILLQLILKHFDFVLW